MLQPKADLHGLAELVTSLQAKWCGPGLRPYGMQLAWAGVLGKDGRVGPKTQACQHCQDLDFGFAATLQVPHNQSNAAPSRSKF